jgi:copper transport protein
LITAGALASCLVLPGNGVARAASLRHATLVSSEPAADSLMPAGLTRFRLVFSEPITPDLSGASLAASDGRTIALVVTGDPRDVHALIAPVPPLDAGAYRLAWRIVSADGHPVKGSIGFRVAERTVDTVAPMLAPVAPPVPAATSSDHAAAGPTVAGAPIIAALLRGAGVGALMGLVGLLAFATWLAPTPDDRFRRLAGWLAIAAPVLLTAHLLAWLVDISPTHDLDAGAAMTTLGTTLGRVEGLRVALAWLALWAFALARRNRIALVLAAASLVVSGAIGHSAAISPALAIPAKVLHLGGVALWLGGLLWLASADRAEPIGFARSAGRVSSIALASVIVVALSGVVQTVLILPSIADLVRSAYGVDVLAKIAGLGVLVLFGAHHRYRVMPRLTDSADCIRMAHSVTREVAVMAIVVLLGGLLAYIPPPTDSPTHPSTSSGESIS